MACQENAGYRTTCYNANAVLSLLLCISALTLHQQTFQLAEIIGSKSLLLALRLVYSSVARRSPLAWTAAMLPGRPALHPCRILLYTPAAAAALLQLASLYTAAQSYN